MWFWHCVYTHTHRKTRVAPNILCKCSCSPKLIFYCIDKHSDTCVHVFMYFSGQNVYNAHTIVFACVRILLCEHFNLESSKNVNRFIRLCIPPLLCTKPDVTGHAFQRNLFVLIARNFITWWKAYHSFNSFFITKNKFRWISAENQDLWFYFDTPKHPHQYRISLQITSAVLVSLITFVRIDPSTITILSVTESSWIDWK